jgi:hypothetical protein
MTYACPTWTHAADSHPLKCSPCRTEYSALLETMTGAHQSTNCMWLSKFLTCMTMTKLLRTQAEVILNRVNLNVRGIGQEEARHWRCKWLKLGGSQAYNRPTNCSFKLVRHNLLHKPSLTGNLYIPMYTLYKCYLG